MSRSHPRHQRRRCPVFSMDRSGRTEMRPLERQRSRQQAIRASLTLLPQHLRAACLSQLAFFVLALTLMGRRRKLSPRWLQALVVAASLAAVPFALLSADSQAVVWMNAVNVSLVNDGSLQ